MSALAKNHTTSKFLADGLTPAEVLTRPAVAIGNKFHPDWAIDP
jgi:hypothetical protein